MEYAHLCHGLLCLLTWGLNSECRMSSNLTVYFKHHSDMKREMFKLPFYREAWGAISIYQMFAISLALC